MAALARLRAGAAGLEEELLRRARCAPPHAPSPPRRASPPFLVPPPEAPLPAAPAPTQSPASSCLGACGRLMPGGPRARPREAGLAEGGAGRGRSGMRTGGVSGGDGRGGRPRALAPCRTLPQPVASPASGVRGGAPVPVGRPESCVSPLAVLEAGDEPPSPHHTKTSPRARAGC